MKKSVVFILMVSLFFACSKSKLDKSLEFAGENRHELEKVLDYYKQQGDKQKLLAAQFLIANMSNKFSYQGNILTYYDKILYLYDSLRRDSVYIGDPPIILQTWDSIVKKHGNIDVSKLQKVYDCQHLKSDFLIRNIDQAFVAWKKSPLYNPSNFDLFCEYVLPYRIGEETVEEYKERYYSDLIHLVDTATTVSGIVFGFHLELYWNRYYKPSQKLWSYPLDFPISKMELGRRGACRHMATFGGLAMRACGLPVAIDRAVWANRSQGHLWNVLMLDSGKIFPFDALGRGRIELAYKPAKIFRKTYSYNLDVLNQINKNDVPSSFFVFDEKDVTHEYVDAYDIIVPIQFSSSEYKNKKNAIICVFDNKKWRIVYWGDIVSKNMCFKNMAANVAYIAAYYDKGNIVPATEPFLLRSNGQIEFCKATMNRKISLRVERKFPRFKRIEEHALGLRRTNAEGANNLSFKDSTLFFSIYNIPYQITDSLINNRKKFRYVRFNASTYRLANYAEVEFYGKRTSESSEKKLSGRIIGYPSITKEQEHPYTHAMDGNLETWFQKAKEEIGWVGLDLGKGNEHIITRVRFCPRSDTNFIIKGDTYELMYWSQNRWNSMGKKVASKYNFLIYNNVPSGTIYILHNCSHGKEERIFTYENGKQVWW